MQPTFDVNHLRALLKIRPRSGQEWVLYTYLLNKDIVKGNEVDTQYGSMIFIGTFPSKEAAAARAKELIKITRYERIFMCKTLTVTPLITTVDPSAVTMVTADGNKEVEEERRALALYNKEIEERTRVEEERNRINEELLTEREYEQNPDHIEHFKRHCYLAIKHRSMYEMYKSKVDELTETFNEEKNLIRDHYRRHPEHEAEFLSFLKEKLDGRGERELYAAMEDGYHRLRDELLGMDSKEALPLCEKTSDVKEIRKPQIRRTWGVPKIPHHDSGQSN